MSHRGDLGVPPGVSAETKAVELLSIWSVQGEGQSFMVRADAFEDPAAWGLLTADLLRHAARAVAQSEGHDEREVLARIKAGFDAEWNEPQPG